MTVSSLARKKMDMFCNSINIQMEKQFIEKFIFQYPYLIESNCGISINDFYVIIDRVLNFHGNVIGVEVHPDSIYPFYVFCWEDYISEYSIDWIESVYNELKLNGITNHIILVLDFPESIVKQYIKI